MSVMEYKCPNCGAKLTFDSNVQKMCCEYCDSTFNVNQLREYEEAVLENKESEFDWIDYSAESGSGNWTDEEADNLKKYACPSCGGEIIGDATIAATTCPYCDSATIMPGQLEGILKPDYVIPFKKDKEEARNAFKRLCKGKKLLPDGFASEARVESIKGIYVPFWLFDCKAEASVKFKGRRVTSWMDSHYHYTKTDTYLLAREGDASFDRVPADGSTKMDDTFMESIEPYNYDELEDFTTAYLSGYLADKYDVESKELLPRINERIENSCVSMMRDTTTMFSSVNVESKSIRLKDNKISYALLPVWLLNTVYNGKTYTFMMNGQTGKFVGDLPVCKQKVRKYFCISTAISLAVTLLIAVAYIL